MGLLPCNHPSVDIHEEWAAFDVRIDGREAKLEFKSTYDTCQLCGKRVSMAKVPATSLKTSPHP